MSNLVKLLTGVAGLAAVAGFATPAAAQYYPGYGYNNGGVVGAIINGVIGSGQYGYGNYGYGRTNDNYAVDQCSRAVEARLNGSGYGYNQSYGYGQPYGYANQGYGSARIAGITRIERRSNGGLKVYGVAMSNSQYGQYGGYGAQGYGQPYGYGSQGYGNQGYGYQNAGRPDLRFNCKIDRYGRITDVDVNRVAYNQNDYYYGYRRY